MAVRNPCVDRFNRVATRLRPRIRRHGVLGTLNLVRQRTIAYQCFLTRWAKRLAWKGVADAVCATWENVFRSVDGEGHEVGPDHRDLGGIRAIGVDEVQCSGRFARLHDDRGAGGP